METGVPNAAGAVEERCPICLDEYQDKAFIVSCFHAFCFSCVLRAAQTTDNTCPMCKTKFNRVLHNIRANDDYDVYKVPPVPAASSSTRLQTMENLDEAIRNFRGYRTTMLPGRQTAIIDSVHIHLPTSSFSGSDVHMAAREQRSGADQQQERDFGRNVRMSSAGRKQERDFGRNIRMSRRCAPVATRRSVYSAGVRALPLDESTGRKHRIRDIRATFFRRNPASMHQLAPWLAREFQALLGEEHVEFMIQLILSLIDKVDLESEAFGSHLAPFLNEKTSHFMHELVSFAKSPYDIIAYDGKVKYNWPARHPEATRPPDTEEKGSLADDSSAGPSSSLSRDMRQHIFDALLESGFEDSDTPLVHSPIVIHGSDSEEEDSESIMDHSDNREKTLSSAPNSSNSTSESTEGASSLLPRADEHSRARRSKSRERTHRHHHHHHHKKHRSKERKEHKSKEQKQCSDYENRERYSKKYKEIYGNSSKEYDNPFYYCKKRKHKSRLCFDDSATECGDSEEVKYKHGHKKKLLSKTISHDQNPHRERKHKSRFYSDDLATECGESEDVKYKHPHRERIKHKSRLYSDDSATECGDKHPHRERKHKSRLYSDNSATECGESEDVKCKKKKSQSKAISYDHRERKHKSRLYSGDSATECGESEDVKYKHPHRERKHKSRLYSDDSATECESEDVKCHKKKLLSRAISYDKKYRSSSSLQSDLKRSWSGAGSCETDQELMEEARALDDEIQANKRKILKSALKKERIELLHRSMHETGPSTAKQKKVGVISSESEQLKEELHQLEMKINSEKRQLLTVTKRIEEESTD